ncbi:hypothetical protein K2F43_04575 [Clostridium estertheticum]|uniref:hypothetical protein n=1 Tax=Clostridium estertheticum TaxID=238834 RepID=UPI001C6EF216|nr:hypothetical protein [Clostridium estertheticum]MBW9170480.1 hypothetical protein [Clostridium estertheticum]WLC75061.1 hypothetical protein KTC99_20435 [Clostridium estertheticum]
MGETDALGYERMEGNYQDILKEPCLLGYGDGYGEKGVLVYERMEKDYQNASKEL